MLAVDNLTIAHKKNIILQGFNLHLATGDIFAMLGDNGSGKSSALRFIAGLDTAVMGSVYLHQLQLSDHGQHLFEAELRQMGMVFQDYALFPHMTIEKNIAFAMRNLSRQKRGEKVAFWLDLIKLSGIERKYPHQLSGGEQQRIALVRALAAQPKLLLLDEPFANLDKYYRQSLVAEVREILKQANVGAILVTHDSDEAHTFADRVGVIKDKQLKELK